MPDLSSWLMASGDATALLDDDFAAVILDVESSDLAAQTLRYQFQRQGFAFDVEDVGIVEGVQDLFGAVIERTQKNRSRQLAATVDTDEHCVLRIEFEVQPGAAVRNDARGVQQLAGAVGLAAVMIEEHARRTMQLGKR